MNARVRVPYTAINNKALLAKTSGLPLASAIYEGRVSHSRLLPSEWHFNYKVYMVYLALDELEQVLKLSGFWSQRWWAPARFRRQDFHGDDHLPLDVAVRKTVETALGEPVSGRIFMLANWRYWGFNMNPLVTYYCHDEQDNLRAIVAEVHNTPWGERHSYVLPVNTDNKDLEYQFAKAFTVSPFNPLNMQYLWQSTKPSQSLRIRIATMQEANKITDAELLLTRREMSPQALNRILIQYPIMTVKVFVAIYWQALRLFLRGVPFLGKNKIYSFIQTAKNKADREYAKRNIE